MKPRSEMTDAEETAYWYEAMADEILDELSYIPSLEVAQGLIDRSADLSDSDAHRVAAVIRHRVAGQGVLQCRPSPAPAPKPVANVRAKPAPAPSASGRDLFS